MTPVINSLSPVSGTLGNSLTITGTGFSNQQGILFFLIILFLNDPRFVISILKADVSVLIGNVACNVQSVSETQIECILGPNSAGSYPVIVKVDPFGFSNKNIQFRYILEVSTLSPFEGKLNIY